mmetsp:Transcript_6928/g.22998  ORF Transcript_6928/g.22998 Transcript_6928/m.22998 type:complete len:200 (+) Transcript_6928:7150-7749(+)
MPCSSSNTTGSEQIEPNGEITRTLSASWPVSKCPAPSRLDGDTLMSEAEPTSTASPALRSLWLKLRRQFDARVGPCETRNVKPSGSTRTPSAESHRTHRPGCSGVKEIAYVPSRKFWITQCVPVAPGAPVSRASMVAPPSAHGFPNVSTVRTVSMHGAPACKPRKADLLIVHACGWHLPAVTWSTRALTTSPLTATRIV